MTRPESETATVGGLSSHYGWKETMQRLTDEQRRELLAKHVASLVSQGRIIETQSLTNTTLSHGRFLTRREVASVDEVGNFSLEALPPRRGDLLRVVTIGLAIFIVTLLTVIRIAIAVS